MKRKAPANSTHPPPAQSDGEPSQNGSLARAPAHGLVAAGQAQPAVIATTTAKSIMEMLAARFTPKSLGDRLEEMLDADIHYTTQGGEAKSKPDQSTRLRALELILAYLVGRPVERQEVIQHNAPASMDDLIRKAEESPVFLATLLEMLQTIVAKQAAGK